MAKSKWEETETTADIWNGRWTRHMWEKASPSGSRYHTICRRWISIITSNLFEAQSALSRHRFKLMKRMKNPSFERALKTQTLLKERIIDQYNKTIPTRITVKLSKRDSSKQESEQPVIESRVKKRKRSEQ